VTYPAESRLPHQNLILYDATSVQNSFQKFAPFQQLPLSRSSERKISTGRKKSDSFKENKLWKRATNREKNGLPNFVFIAMILVSVVGLLYVFVHQ
jgi:hypothetical protein